MNTSKETLIIGAGATGLSSALFLSEAGYKPRIVEKRKAPSTITKALGINPNTLQLFENTEITNRFLQNGWKCQCMNFWCKDKLVYKNDFSKVKHKYPFMLIQPQWETEAIIEQALIDRGIYVERGMNLESLSSTENSTLVRFSNDENGVDEIDFNGIIIGADGNKSKVREQLGTEFKGWEHKELFTLYDMELETPITHKEGHYRFYKEGGMLMLHIRDGVWRVGGNIKDVLNYLPKGTKTGKITWETTFTIREKIATQFRKNKVYLLGDAAHIHSPAGAKGMNMCIEDSYIFANLLKQNKELDYHRVRHPAIKRTVGIIGQLTDKVGGNNFAGRTIRNNMDKLSFLFPLVMPQIRKFLLALK